MTMHIPCLIAFIVIVFGIGVYCAYRRFIK